MALWLNVIGIGPLGFRRLKLHHRNGYSKSRPWRSLAAFNPDYKPSSYREAISARLTGIRDFLLLFFFIDMGAKLDFSTLDFERRRPFRELAVEQQAHGTEPPEVVIFGLGRYGERLAKRLHDAGLSVLGVDFDPELVRRLRRQGMAVRFGDGQDPNYLDSLPLEGAPWAVSTLPDSESNRALLYALAARRNRGQARSHNHYVRRSRCPSRDF